MPVRLAAERVLARARAETARGASGALYLDVTNRTALVRGFDGLGRGEAQAQLSLGYNFSNISASISVGALAQDLERKHYKLMFEGSYLSADIGGARIYAGYLDHWWGPGQISALSLSNNARPMPQIGIQRSSTTASSWPVLRWLGPWQVEFLLGYLDGPRIERDTYYNALRLTVNPAPGLEIGLARTQGHPCEPLRDYFAFGNNARKVNNTNDQGLFDIKYSRTIGNIPMQVYMQVMNEDSSPIVQSGSSHLFGASVFLPTGENPVRLTAEYTDSVPTHSIFSFGDARHGIAYNNGDYPDGMRYRGRSLGFSLDSDSRLFSLQGGWTDRGGRFYQLSYHRADVSHPLNTLGNAVTAAPVKVNLGEARFTLPFRSMKFELAGRYQNDQPRPRRGAVVSVQAALRLDL
ncbi:MAG: hypothetical protein RL274_456 [Pseudomonadota bacterium]|jgi:hypothetical protein